MVRPLLCTGNSSLAVENHTAKCECSARKRFTFKTEGDRQTACGDVYDVCHLPSPLKLDDMRNYFVHSQCIHNVVDALRRRVNLCTPFPTKDRIRQLRALSRELGRAVGVPKRMTYDEVINCYGGFKRRRYERAAQDIEAKGFIFDPRLTIFIKQEGIEYKASKVNPACRAIQFRSPTFTLELSTYIKPLEKLLCKPIYSKNFPRDVFVAKSYTPRQRASAIRKKIANIPGCWILELDVTRFDAHVCEDLLKIEHEFYNAAYGDVHLRHLLRGQLKNRGSCKCKDYVVKYSTNGTRASGDPNTGCGNCVIMSIILALLGRVFNRKIDFLDDGDDSVLFYSGDRIEDEDIFEFFRSCGMTVKIDNHTQDSETVTFCQGRIVDLSNGPLLVRDPFKILIKTLINPKFADKKIRPKLLNTIATGELSIFTGCPVIDPFYRCLKRIAMSHMSNRGKRDKGLLKGRHWMEYRQERDLPGDWARERYVEITSAARVSFSRVWGISEKKQIELEEHFSKWSFDLMNEPVRGNGVEIQRWFFDLHYPETYGSVVGLVDPHTF